tara:strand:- start:585 stop:1091 length:507 start_codon:yes stop_codon:yes gene_type:complete
MYQYLILPLAFAITACGSNGDEMASGSFGDGDGNKGNYTVFGDEANSATVIKMDAGELRLATGDQAVKELPMDIKLYPGAEIQTSMSGAGEGKSGAMVVFSTTDSADEVIAFYHKELESNGIMFKTEIKSGDMRVIGGERPDGESVHISVAESPDGRVTATIIVGGDR